MEELIEPAGFPLHTFAGFGRSPQSRAFLRAAET
jgi:hypothetical protein